MLLEEVRITRFRSIESCDVTVGLVTALVGANNSGKSSFLRALNSFFNYKKEHDDFISGHHQYGPRSYPRIELVFGRLPDEQKIHELAENNKLTLRFSYKPKTQQPAFHAKRNGKYQAIDISFIDHLKQFIDYVLIPSNRDVSNFQWQEEALLPVVIHEYLARHLQNRDTVTPHFKKASGYLERTALNKIAKHLVKYYGIKSNLEFHIGYDGEINYKHFLNQIRFKVKEQGGYFDINDCGSGIQSLAIIALYRLISSLRSSNIIIGVEEPESNLHPQAQKQLVASLKQVGTEGWESQIVFTTHSTVLVDQLDHSDVILVRKVSDTNRGFRTSLTQIKPNFLARHNLEQMRYYKFHKYRNSDFFYSKLVILVEGENDTEILRVLMEQKKIEIDNLPVSILNLNGIDNLKYPFYLLKELKLPYFIILDKDYFLPYANDELEKSRYESGFPKYRFEYQQDCLVSDLIPSRTDRQQLIKLFQSNHSRALDLLEKHNIVCMKYSLEIDLVASKTASGIFFDRLNVPQDSRTSKELLISRKKQIKKLDNLLYVVKNTPHKNLPNSYKRIKRVLPRLIDKYCKT